MIKNLKKLNVLKDMKVNKVSNAFKKGKTHLLKEDGYPQNKGLFIYRHFETALSPFRPCLI